MKTLTIGTIPAVLWGKPSPRVYLYVHGKFQSKMTARPFALLAEEKGFQTLSFDLPGHGDRAGNFTPCDIFHAIPELKEIKRYVDEKWNSVSLFACSIGAYFSLHAYRDERFERCLFESPVVDMTELISNLFGQFGVTEERLRDQKEIPTPVETLRWDYYLFVKENPVERWNTPTQILYGAKDTVQSENAVRSFTERFGGSLTVSQNSGHGFLSPSDGPVLREWLVRYL